MSLCQNFFADTDLYSTCNPGVKQEHTGRLNKPSVPQHKFGIASKNTLSSTVITDSHSSTFHLLPVAALAPGLQCVHPMHHCQLCCLLACHVRVDHSTAALSITLLLGCQLLRNCCFVEAVKQQPLETSCGLSAGLASDLVEMA